MTKADIKKAVSEAIVDALTIEVKYEKRRDEKTGQPLATPEIITEKEYLPIWWVRYLPHYEASNRGIQETQDKQANKMIELSNQIKQLKEGMEAIGNVVFQAEESLKCISAISDQIKGDTIQIESHDN